MNKRRSYLYCTKNSGIGIEVSSNDTMLNNKIASITRSQFSFKVGAEILQNISYEVYEGPSVLRVDIILQSFLDTD